MRFTNISNQINVRVNNTFITWYVIISLSVPASPHTVPCLCSASMLPPLDTQRRVVASLPCSVLLRYIYKGESPLHYHAPLLCSTRTQHRVPLFFCYSLAEIFVPWNAFGSAPVCHLFTERLLYRP